MPPKNPNLTGGSRKGVPNKVTADVKAMIQEALDRAGGSDYLLRQSEEYPQAFLSLVGKILPKDMKLDVSVGGLADFVEAVSEAARTKPR